LEPGPHQASGGLPGLRSGAVSSIRVLIADDQALLRSGFRMILDAQADIEVVGEASDGSEAIRLAEELRPDIVLMDVRMPDLDGLEATRRLTARENAPKVVMLTTFDTAEVVYEAMQAGASGFLVKDLPPEQLASGIRTVAAGDALLAPTVTRRLIEEFVRRPPPGAAEPSELGELTDREAEVLRLIARGLSNAEIAQELVVSEATVKTHVAHVLRKLDLRDRVQAVVYAYESGLIQPGS
jgi:DNA-binding NarL/FixJ family response regulator